MTILSFICIYFIIKDIYREIDLYSKANKVINLPNYLLCYHAIVKNIWRVVTIILLFVYSLIYAVNI